MSKAPKPVAGLKHESATRLYIPSREEAGNEPLPQPPVLTLPLNPVTTRGQDPELMWMHKYGANDDEQLLNVDIRSLYRHEHVVPELLINRLHRLKTEKLEAIQHELDLFATLGNAMQIDELEKPQSYYTHGDDWKNRLIQGDSLLVMTSLLEREGMAGKVQMIYVDPPYGIKYGSNWQMKLGDRNVKDGADEALSGEPEVVKAFRDTWELGIHSYLSYLRERLLVARELLTDSGSCFVQISDENVHLVRCLMDEVFGAGNFVSLITFKKTASQTSRYLSSTSDYLVWYSKNAEVVKYHPLYQERLLGDEGADAYRLLRLADGEVRPVKQEEVTNPKLLPNGAKPFRYQLLTSQREGRPSGPGSAMNFPVVFNNKTFVPAGSRGWTTTQKGLNKLIEKNRLGVQGASLSYIRYLEDFPAVPMTSFWHDTQSGSGMDKVYVVQTNQKIIERCILMTTDPGDLVLDPTCGSGTTAHVAEQWGRRWITTDTSRIALNIAKSRLMTATYPWFKLKDEGEAALNPSPASGRGAGERARAQRASEPTAFAALIPPPDPSGHPLLQAGEGNSVATPDIRNGFIYKTVPHVTLKSLANDEPPDTETLYDQPERDSKRLRVAGPFTVETLQAFEPVSPESLDDSAPRSSDAQAFEQRIFEHLKSAGIKNGVKNENAVFTRITRLASAHLHAEGYYPSAAGERKAYLVIGPQFAAVSRALVNEAVKECRARGDADWLILLGFAFESGVVSSTQAPSPPAPLPQAGEGSSIALGGFIVTKVRMHDDLLQAGLLKKDKKAASFVTIGEPDVSMTVGKGQVTVQIEGFDIYDPIADAVKPRSLSDIAYWMLDDDYDGANFIVRQVFFCGSSDKDEFSDFRKGLSDLAKQSTRKRAEATLKIELDDEAFEKLYGFVSHPVEVRTGRKLAVRVVSQFGEESTKVLAV